jgi:hypothetical protein
VGFYTLSYDASIHMMMIMMMMMMLMIIMMMMMMMMIVVVVVMMMIYLIMMMMTNIYCSSWFLGNPILPIRTIEHIPSMICSLSFDQSV